MLINKNAISDQGWNLLNHTLLLDKELKATSMTTKESTAEYLYTFDKDLSTNDMIVPDAYIMNEVHFNLYGATFGEEHDTVKINADRESTHYYQRIG